MIFGLKVRCWIDGCIKLSVNFRELKSYSKQNITDSDIKNVVDVLRSESLSRGPKIKEFEKKLGHFCKNNNVITTNSATSALHLAYKVSGITEGSLVWTTPITFVATANIAMLLGAKLDFVDIDAQTLNLCPRRLEEKLKKKHTRPPDYLVVVHFGGNPCEMKEIFKLSKQYGFKIIEDSSHALGAVYEEMPIGRNDYSLASVFSFHPVKMITTGEGGALMVGSKKIKEKAIALRSHGILEQEKNKSQKIPNWFYEQHFLGYNFRITEFQAALGIGQLARLEKFVNTRNDLASYYKARLSHLPLKFQEVLSNASSSYHLFTIELVDDVFSRNSLYNHLKSKNIGCQVHYIPVHLQPFYKNLGFPKGYLGNAEKYYDRCLSIPLHQGLTKVEIDFVVGEIEKFFSN